MKRKKFLLKDLSNDLFKKNLIINRFKNDIYFEIDDQITSDPAEAVSILMRKIDFNDPVWKTEVRESDIHSISPSKSLFWLTGGNKEWNTLKNYKLPWDDCFMIFEEEFGYLVINAVEKARRLKDIRDYFLKHINLPILYDYAVSKDIVK